MFKGKTSSGFEFRVPEGIKRDFRFVRAYKKLKSANAEEQVEGAAELVSVVFCDKSEEDRFLNHIADTEGRATVDTVYREIGEIIAAAAEDAEIKKS